MKLLILIWIIKMQEFCMDVCADADSLFTKDADILNHVKDTYPTCNYFHIKVYLHYNSTQLTSVLLRELWIRDKYYHRIDGPAIIIYNIHTSSILSEKWYIDGYSHRTDGPATTLRRNDGTLFQEMWFNQGLYHNRRGPALKIYDEFEKVQNEKFYINDKEYNFNDWLKLSDYTDDEKIVFKLKR